MTEMKFFLFFFVIACGIPLQTWAEEFRAFTNREGQEIRARVKDVDGDRAVIERDDGRTFRFKISLLSEEDRKFLREWAIADTFRDEDKIGMRLRQLRRGTNTDRSGRTYRTDRTESHYTYQLVIDNKTPREFRNVTVEYVLFILEADHGSGSGGVMKREGELKFKKIGRRDEASEETERFTLAEVEREERGPWNPDRGRYDILLITSEDRFEGIRLRVKVGDRVVRELAEPENMPARFSW